MLNQWQDEMIDKAKDADIDLGLRLTGSIALERACRKAHEDQSKEVDRLIALIPSEPDE
jgi:hypothetical protein